MSHSAKSGAKAPEHTQEEARFLKHLVDRRSPVRIKLKDNEWIDGTVEYFDASFIRVTRTNAPNLFVFKHDIKYLLEIEPAV
ncbi:RNA chaperone Hfq [Nevskia soli]|jgi:sRNA-binding regulator protein Hfq|uniref:RNA chaperone Hfq n=1 Tax=Nevskia soli TaxID=418856 RepID=UPI0015D7C080|nr:RNA chaperone Hfq [Nevskia soli]